MATYVESERKVRLQEAQVERDIIYSEFRDFLVGEAIGSVRYLAFLDSLEQLRIKIDLLLSQDIEDRGNNPSEGSPRKEEEIVKLAVVDETIRTRKDTLPGYSQAKQEMNSYFERMEVSERKIFILEPEPFVKYVGHDLQPLVNISSRLVGIRVGFQNNQEEIRPTTS